METLTSWASSAGASIAGVANELATKVEKLSEDLQVKQKLAAVGEASEEKFAVLSGTYKALVVAYLTSLANGTPPQPELLDDAFIFSDENGTRPKDFVLSELTYRGRKCAGTVEIFSEGATFGFKMTQTIEFAPGFKLISGRSVVSFFLSFSFLFFFCYQGCWWKESRECGYIWCHHVRQRQNCQPSAKRRFA